MLEIKLLWAMSIACAVLSVLSALAAIHLTMLSR